MRSIPMRIYLPHGGPIIQDIVPVMTTLANGEVASQTLESALSTLLPALFPSVPPSGSIGMSASFVATGKQLVKRVIVQGIQMPLDAELGWCAAYLAYPDGWLGVVLGV